MNSLLTSLLGERNTDQKLAEAIQKLGALPEVSSDDESTYYEFKQKGISLLFGKEGKLGTIFLYGKNDEGFSPYDGDMPYGIDFTWSREKVREKIGYPDTSGQAASILARNIIEKWDRYNTEWGAIHFRYLDDGEKLVMITLMSSEDIPQSG
jgi:hypothetical protein